ncbi:MAG: molybdopterin-dependent oxidoreductase [Actinomycetota bacterium]
MDRDPLAPILRGRIRDDAVELVFTGADHTGRGRTGHQRSLPIADALREEVLLAYAVNDSRSRRSTASRSVWFPGTA